MPAKWLALAPGRRVPQPHDRLVGPDPEPRAVRRQDHLPVREAIECLTPEYLAVGQVEDADDDVAVLVDPDDQAVRAGHEADGGAVPIRSVRAAVAQHFPARVQ